MNKYIKGIWKDAIVTDKGVVIEPGTLIKKNDLDRIEDGVEGAILNAVPILKTTGTEAELIAKDNRIDGITSIDELWEGYGIKIILHVAPTANATVKIGNLPAVTLGIKAKSGDVLLVIFDGSKFVVKKVGGSDIVPVPTAETQILISDMSEQGNAKYKTVGFAAAKARPVSNFKAAISDKWQKLKEPFDSDLLAYIDFEDGLVPKVGDFTITQEGTEETQGYFGKGRGINKGSSECYLSTNAKVAPMSGPVSFRFKINIIDLMAKASLITTVASWNVSSTGFTMMIYNGGLQWGYVNGGATYFDTTLTPPVVSCGWHDIICTWTGDKTTNGVKIYIDGLLYTQATATGLNIGGSGNLQIGKLISVSKVNRYEIDEIEVYNTVKAPFDFVKNDKINLLWQNPTNITFNQETVIRRSDENYPATISDGIEVYKGVGENCIDTSADTSVNQYYSAFGDNGIMPSDAVNVDSNGGEEQLVNYTMLYDQGDECQSVTGGWETKKIGSPTITKNLHNVYMRSSGTGNDCQINTTSKVNLSGYNQIHARTKITITGNAETYLAVSDNCTDWARLELTKAKINVTQDGVLKLDLADLGQKFLKLEVDQSGGTNETYVYNLFAVKQDDYRTLCTKAGATAPASLNELIADTAKLTTIFASDKAISYMIARCTGDFMVAVLNDSSARALLKASPYLNKVIANIHWAKFMMILAPELLNYTMLYDNGDECEAVTGGWEIGIDNTRSPATSSRAKNADNLELNATLSGINGADIGYVTKNAIKLNGYASLGCRVNAEMSARHTDPTNSSGYHLYVGDEKNISPPGVSGVTKGDYYGNYDGILKLPLNIENKYVQVSVRIGNPGGIIKSKTYQVWMEKQDNWQAWMQKGGVTGFTELAALLADSTAVATLMASKAACEYLMGCTGDLMVAICNSETAMNALVDNIAYDYVFKHPVWFKFMTMCPVSLAAMDSVARTVPTMTSNTAPSGEAFILPGYGASYRPYFMFDKDPNTFAGTSTSQGGLDRIGAPFPHYFGYKFEAAVELYKFEIKKLSITGQSGGYNPKNYIVQASDDNINYVDIASGMVVGVEGGSYVHIIDNPVKAKYYRIKASDSYYMIYNWTGIFELQFYGKAVD